MPFRELQADLWSGAVPGNAVCITTNGDVNRNGEAVMGAGTALQARERFPHLAIALGKKIKQTGNHCYPFGYGGWSDSSELFHEYYIVSFPTKKHWRDRLSSLSLIEQSVKELVLLTNLYNMSNLFKEVYLPRPGCGKGNLDWIQVVTSGALDELDERFVVVYQ